MYSIIHRFKVLNSTNLESIILLSKLKRNIFAIIVNTKFTIETEVQKKKSRPHKTFEAFNKTADFKIPI